LARFLLDPAVEQAALVGRVTGLGLVAAALEILVQLLAAGRQQGLDLAGAVGERPSPLGELLLRSLIQLVAGVLGALPEAVLQLGPGGLQLHLAFGVAVDEVLLLLSVGLEQALLVLAALQLQIGPGGLQGGLVLGQAGA